MENSVMCCSSPAVKLQCGAQTTNKLECSSASPGKWTACAQSPAPCVCMPSLPEEPATSTTSSLRLQGIDIGIISLTLKQLSWYTRPALWGPRGLVWNSGSTTSRLWDFGQATWPSYASVSPLIQKDNNAYFNSSLEGERRRMEEGGREGKVRKHHGKKEKKISSALAPCQELPHWHTFQTKDIQMSHTKQSISCLSWN